MIGWQTSRTVAVQGPGLQTLLASAFLIKRLQKELSEPESAAWRLLKFESPKFSAMRFQRGDLRSGKRRGLLPVELTDLSALQNDL